MRDKIEALISEIMTIFYETTYIPIKYIDSKGNIVDKYGEKQDVCEYFYEISRENRLCEKCHLKGGMQALELGESYIYFCPVGLTEFVYPIVENKEFLGAIIGGPVNMDIPTEKLVDKIIINNGLKLKNKRKLYLYLQQVMLVDTKRVRYLSKLIEKLATGILEENKLLLKEKFVKMKQQSEINDIIYSLKYDTPGHYPYEKERELYEKVKNGDVKEAKVILNELLGYILYSNGNSIGISKTRVFELCSMLSRAAIEGGADLTKIFGMNYKFLTKLSKLNTIDEISYWLLEVLNNFTESINEIQDIKKISSGNKFKEALKYIKQNYKENLTLEIVSQEIGISTKYLSSMFKKNIYQNFSSYVNFLRIEEAKRLLQYTDRTLFDIAISVGFEDASYFSKVFKKITSLSPKQYKKINLDSDKK